MKKFLLNCVFLCGLGMSWSAFSGAKIYRKLEGKITAFDDEKATVETSKGSYYVKRSSLKKGTRLKMNQKFMIWDPVGTRP